MCAGTCYAALLAFAVHFAAHAQELPVALHCARGVPDYPDAEMKLGRGRHRVVDVTFVGFRPSRVRADWSLRDCLHTAIKFDGSQDIVARLWYRAPRLRSPREPLQPYGGATTLVYRASSRKIVPRDTEKITGGAAIANGP